MVDSFTFNEKSTLDFNLLISGYGSFRTPAKDVTMMSVAGRNGDLTIDNGRFENVEITYKALIYKELMANFKQLTAYLMTQKGYKRLEDTFHKDEYRIGVYKNAIEPKLKGYGAASFDIVFNCKPQRFLKIGDEAINCENEVLINNPTLFEAKPIIRVFNSGTLNVNGNELEISNVDGYIDIDSEIMNAYKGNLNMNSHISGEFPTLSAGDNLVTFDGEFTIIPRWYTI